MNKAYARLLRDRRWIAKSARIRRERGKCADCGTTESLRCHHGYYEKKLKPWEYPDSSIWVLCVNCHAKMDHFRKMAAKLVGRIHPHDAEGVLRYLDSAGRSRGG